MKIIVHVMIGFLGSGKTSALLHILHNSARVEKIGVIVGEFADEGYDGHKLQEAGFPVMMISGVGRRDQIAAYTGSLQQMVDSGRFQLGLSESEQIATPIFKTAEEVRYSIKTISYIAQPVIFKDDDMMMVI